MIMKTRRYKKTKSTEKSKYRFSKSETYTDLNGKRYFYDGKAMGCFYFLTIDIDGKHRRFSGYERDLDLLNLTKNK